MSEERNAYEKSITNTELAKVGFKLPKLLYEALQIRMKAEGYVDGIGNYYFYLTSYEFYQQYKEIFYRVKEGIAPIANSMQLSELPNFNISNEAAWEIMKGKMTDSPVMIYQLPITHLQVCQHLAECLHYHKSASILYRFFTIKILIAKLQHELAILRSDSEPAPTSINQQTLFD
ncbi:MAG: hypothetical protein ACPGJS_00785 [Flammeovirgaceae bacterium]